MVDKDEKIKIDVTNIDDSNYCSIQLGRCVLRTAGLRAMSHIDHRNAQYFTIKLMVTTRLSFLT
jgi:hypothetical protein